MGFDAFDICFAVGDCELFAVINHYRLRIIISAFSLHFFLEIFCKSCRLFFTGVVALFCIRRQVFNVHERLNLWHAVEFVLFVLFVFAFESLDLTLPLLSFRRSNSGLHQCWLLYASHRTQAIPVPKIIGLLSPALWGWLKLDVIENSPAHRLCCALRAFGCLTVLHLFILLLFQLLTVMITVGFCGDARAPVLLLCGVLCALVLLLCACICALAVLLFGCSHASADHAHHRHHRRSVDFWMPRAVSCFIRLLRARESAPSCNVASSFTCVGNCSLLIMFRSCW